MPIKWINYVRRNGDLKVFHKGNDWKKPIEKALDDFNGLNLGVTLTFVDRQPAANIVVKVATGADKIDFDDGTYSGTVKTKPSFKPDEFHGYCGSMYDPDKNEVVFAGVFLPGKIKATDNQKRVVVLHEFIHACGLNGRLPNGTDDPNGDHDIEGIMTGQMKTSGTGLIEYMPMKGAVAMPPIRISGRTLCAARMLWTNATSCDEN